MKYEHYSVMAAEAIEFLNIKPDGTYVDCTLGGGGHTVKILNKLNDNGRVIGIDRDETAIQNARTNINDSRLITVKSNYCEIKSVIESSSVESVDGVLMDLGVSSYQLDTPERGFSYRQDSPLDMRMDTEDRLTAAEVVNGYPVEELVDIFRKYGEERHAGRIAAAIERKRSVMQLTRSGELIDVIKQAVPDKNPVQITNSVKRVFQAIRIEVNAELALLEKSIEAATECLKPGGRLVVISFHSLEDRIVKNTFINLARCCECPPDYPICVCNKKPSIKIVTKKPIIPCDNELAENSRSHSAKLRCSEKI